MKRIYFSLVCILFLPGLLASQVPPPAPIAVNAGPPKPLYIYLYARATDHVNMDITEARLRRLLPMMEHYRNQHPEAHLTATVFFSGASSEALAKRNSETGIKDFVLGYKARNVIEIGYDGTDEPSYEQRPMASKLAVENSDERWAERTRENERFLTEGRDPLTGAPRPDSMGGLQAMQHVFGKASCITGVSIGTARLDPGSQPNAPGLGAVKNQTPEVGDWEVVPILRKYNTEAILFGLPASNPAHIPGFGGSIAEIGRILSPAPSTSPEIFWEDNILRTSESSGNGARVLHGYEGGAALKDFTSKLDRSKLRVIHMEMGSELDYLKPDFAKTPLSPPLTYAYAHPDNPKLPSEVRLSPEEVNLAFAKEEASLNWLLSEYFAANPSSRFVSNSDLKQMAGESTGFSIPVDQLRAAMKDATAAWGADTYPPSYFQVGTHYLSLAETFQVLTDALAELSRTGSLPQSVRVLPVRGPIQMMMGHGPNLGDATVADVAKACTQFAPALRDDSEGIKPKNSVPSLVKVNGVTTNAAQFLRLMAAALADPTPTATLRVRMTYMTTATTHVFPKTRGLEDTGATWTLKPAPLNAEATALASR